MERAAETCCGVNIEKPRYSDSAEEEVALELPDCYIIRHKKLANTSPAQTNNRRMCENRRTVMGHVDSVCGNSATSPSEINCKWNKIRREELGRLSNSELMDLKTHQQTKCKMNDTCERKLEMKMVQQRVESQGEEENELRNLQKGKACSIQKLHYENVNKWGEKAQIAPKSVMNMKSIFSTIRRKMPFGSKKQELFKKLEKVSTCSNCNSLVRSQDYKCRSRTKDLDNGRTEEFLKDVSNVTEVMSKSCLCFNTMKEINGKGKCQACNCYDYNPADEERAIKKNRTDKICSFGFEELCSPSGNLDSEMEGATQVPQNFVNSFVTTEDECPSVRKIMAENRCTSQICICAGKWQGPTDHKEQPRIVKCRPGIIPSPLKILKEEHVDACPNKADCPVQQEKCITRQQQNEVKDDNFVDALFNTDISADPWTIIFVPQQMERILNVFNDKDICTVRNPIAIQWCNEMVQAGEAYNRPDLMRMLSAADFSHPLNQSTESSAGPETKKYLYKEVVDRFLKNEYDTRLLKDWHPQRLHTESVSTQTTREPEFPLPRTQSAQVVGEENAAMVATKEEVVTEEKLSESKCYIDASTCMSRVLLPTINSAVQSESKATHEPDLIPPTKGESIMDDIDCKESPVRSKIDLRSKFSYSFPFFS